MLSSSHIIPFTTKHYSFYHSIICLMCFCCTHRISLCVSALCNDSNANLMQLQHQTITDDRQTNRRICRDTSIWRDRDLAKKNRDVYSVGVFLSLCMCYRTIHPNFQCTWTHVCNLTKGFFLWPLFYTYCTITSRQRH